MPPRFPVLDILVVAVNQDIADKKGGLDIVSARTERGEGRDI